tara:strand:- start:8802 stop:9002 length:201 start_codon:yes stop_codon:yes gene_type:complete
MRFTRRNALNQGINRSKSALSSVPLALVRINPFSSTISSITLSSGDFKATVSGKLSVGVALVTMES